MDFFYLYLGLGWVAVSVAAAVLMGHFIAAGKGALPSPTLTEAVARPDVKAEPSTAPSAGQDNTKQMAA